MTKPTHLHKLYDRVKRATSRSRLEAPPQPMVLPLDQTGRTIHFEVCPCTDAYPEDACICGSLYTALIEDREKMHDLGNG